MRLLVAAVGRMKAGPEVELAERYRDRAEKAGRPLGFRGPTLIEQDESRARDPLARKREEASVLSRHAAGRLVALDETGRSITSLLLAETLGAWRDAGEEAVTFVIGGPDGLDPEFRAGVALTLAFGAATWPHQLVRVMLLEQIYRSMTILAGHPYHRA